MFTFSGAGPLSWSTVALAIGGSPVAPPTLTTTLGLVEKFSAESMACVAMRYTPGLFSVTPTVPLVKQQAPLESFFIPTQRSQATCPLSGSVTGKLTVIVLPAGASVGVTLSVPDGGCPGFWAGETVTYSRPC